MTCKHPKQQNPQTGGEGNPAPDHTSGATPIARTFIQIPDSIIEEYRRNNQEQESENRKNRSIAKWAVAGAWIYATIAAFQYFTMQSQVSILHWEEAAQVGILNIEATNFGTDKAEVIITLHNSGKNSAKRFWFRETTWTVGNTFAEQKYVWPMITDFPVKADPNMSPGIKAFNLATQQSFSDMRNELDPSLDFEDQHPVMPSEAVIESRIKTMKALGPLPPEFAQYQINKKIIVGEIGAGSSWPIRVKISADFGNEFTRQSIGKNDKNPPPPDKQASYFGLRYGYDDGLKELRVSPDFCFRYLPEDKAFTYCQKPAD